MVAQVLCIGASDSSAGTGIQADIKTIQAFGAYAATVVTSVSVKNTRNAYDLFPLPAEVVQHQIQAVLDDLRPAVVKTGMLCTEEIVNVVGDFLDVLRKENIRVVVDPVISGKTGKILLTKPVRDAIKRRLMMYADVITPNIREAQELTGLQIASLDDMKHAAEILQTLGARAVLVTGEALETDQLYNILADEDGVEVYEHERISNCAAQGAGTTLSAGLSAGLAMGLGIREAFETSLDFLSEAIQSAGVIGSGYGFVNHNCRSKPVIKKAS
jgi:hydroxymethylpyrimidine/phosphomethylpyrimidine kinase